MQRFLIVDDHAVVRRGLKQILTDEFHTAEVGEAKNAVEMFTLLRQQTWDMVILDITMPEINGLEALKDLKHEHPHLPVLMLTAHPEDQYAMRVLKAGADGFLNKESAPEELIQAAKHLLSGSKYISPSLTARLVGNLQHGATGLSHEALSDREYQVFCLLASGKTVTDTAQELSVSIKTVSTHRTRVLAKMNMHSNAELTRYALQNGLID